MTPSGFQAPPRPPAALQSTWGTPPVVSIFLSLPPAKNAMNRLSGDQNGNDAPSVPGRACASTPSSGRIQIWDAARLLAATNARRRPSGDSASCAAEATGDGGSITAAGAC